jgi:uncharacterized protein (TIGR02246 family)
VRIIPFTGHFTIIGKPIVPEANRRKVHQMRNRIMLALFVVGGCLAFAWGQAQSPRPAQGDEAAIRKAAEALAAAFNKADLDGLMTHWAADADYVDENGKTHKGRNAIAAVFNEALANLKGFQMKSRPISIRFVKPEVAIEDGRMELTAPDGKSESSRYTAVWVKTGDKWLISSARDLPNEAEVTPSEGAKLLKDLEWLVGDWGSSDQALAVQVNCRWALNKHYLVQEYTVKGTGGDDLSVAQWVGWDPQSGQLKSWFFDSRGGHGEGLWERNGNTWTIATVGVVADGRTGSSTNSLQHVDDGTFVWKSRDRELDGQPIADAEIKLIRKQNKP